MTLFGSRSGLRNSDNASAWDDIRGAWDDIRRAFDEFLLVPTCIILLFMSMAVGTYALDSNDSTRFAPLGSFLQAHIFADATATTDLLSTIAGSVITMTSLTITLLLIVVQQSAASLTALVFDQFLRRRHNQIYFGFFVGLALYTLLVLATVDTPFNPVYGATLALLLTVVALFLLMILIYTTINQMRPAVIIATLHDHILASRQRQLPLIRQTRRGSFFLEADRVPVTATHYGFITHVNLAALKKAIATLPDGVEIVLEVSIGSYVAFEDVVAHVKADSPQTTELLIKAVQEALQIEGRRNVQTDPAYGIEQLQMIAWTSISTSKSNPSPGLLTIQSLRDVLAQWSHEESESQANPLPIAYTDNVFQTLMDTFEALAVVSSESMQHQIFIEVARTFATMFNRLPLGQQARAEDLVLRILAALGDHVLTAELDAALSLLTDALKSSGRFETAMSVQAAQEQLQLSVGRLNSRSTRVSKL